MPDKDDFGKPIDWSDGFNQYIPKKSIEDLQKSMKILNKHLDQGQADLKNDPWKKLGEEVVEVFTPPIEAETAQDDIDQVIHKASSPKKTSKKSVVASSVQHIAEEHLVFYPRDVAEEEYGSHTVNIGTQIYTNVTDLLARFFLTSYYHFKKIDNWRDYCIGVTSYLDERPDPDRPEHYFSAHMPMFDYDGKNIKTLIRKDVKLLQENFGLGPAHVFRTKRGFHVIFMCDAVRWDTYLDMLNVVKCCKGFKKCTTRSHWGTLRVSAKYTDFDIEPEYVLTPQENTKAWKKLRKGHLIERLHALGRECGTHIADMYPQWANFEQDAKPWKPRANRPAGAVKRIRKKKAVLQKAKEPQFYINDSGVKISNNTTAGATWNVHYTTTTDGNNW